MAIFTFKQALDKHGVSADQVTNVTKPVTPLQPTQQTAQDGFFSGVASDFNSRVDTAANAQIKSAQGDQSNASGIFQTLGQGAGLVSDIVGRGFNTATGGLVSKAIQKGSEFVPQVIADKGAEAVTAYQGWKDQHPEAAANLEAGVNLGTLLPVGALTKGVAEGGVKATLIGSGKALEVGAGALSVPGRVIRGAGSTLYKTHTNITRGKIRS